MILLFDRRLHISDRRSFNFVHTGASSSVVSFAPQFVLINLPTYKYYFILEPAYCKKPLFIYKLKF
jgi:hypothetical protein